MADTVAAVMRRATGVRPLRLVSGNGPLAHFTARLEPRNGNLTRILKPIHFSVTVTLATPVFIS